MHLLKRALLESRDQVNARAVQRSASVIRGEMSRKLTLADYAVLARVYLDGAINPDETGRRLLYRRGAPLTA